ncbi:MULTISPECIES: hypothetical protein [Bacillaceae]|uniref:hypothetical protein n=1 Tax=Bacillaceae TaxID=186817 RepID=UPI00129316B3|nr:MULTISPECIES: hypothetical protein [Bacillaceae]MCF7623663.1 hypothetical protein [Peribacillus frigoritolerans]
MSKYRLFHVLIVMACMAYFIYSLVVRTPQGVIVTFFAAIIGIGFILLNFAFHKYS